MPAGKNPRRRPVELLTELENTGPAPWGARLQDFSAGGAAPAEVVVVSPAPESPAAGPGGHPDDLVPFFVMVLDERAARVAPGLDRMFTVAGAESASAGSGVEARGRWSALDGPVPFVKLTVEVTAPEPLGLALVLPAEPLSHVLVLAAVGTPVGLVPRLPLADGGEPGTLEETLYDLVLVPTAPSGELLALMETHRWPLDIDPA